MYHGGMAPSAVGGKGESMSVQIILADEQAVVRQGARLLLEAQPDFQVVAEAADGFAAITEVKTRRPDVLIMGLMMPSLSGLEVTRRVRQQEPETGIVILSMYSDESYILEALENGAAGYVLKGSPTDYLLRAVREVAVGRHYLSPPLSEYAIDAYLRQAHTAALDPYESLTAREREVLRLAAQGHSSSDIAARLFISPRTVESHRANLMRKLGLHNQTDLVHYVLRRGILTLSQS
jgi:two-component system, NarL family, response regulator NreC